MTAKTLTVNKALQIALEHHRNGRLPEAEAIYRDILKTDPINADSLHLLGVIALQIGRGDAALELIGEAVRLQPKAPSYLSNLGHALTMLGRVNDAAIACREAISIDPKFFEAHLNLGVALEAQGRAQEAAEAYQASIKLEPKFAQAYLNLGNLLHRAGRLNESGGCFREAVKLAPNNGSAHNNLAAVLLEFGRAEEAEKHARLAVQLQPMNAVTHNTLAFALIEQRRFTEAEPFCHEARRLDPTLPEAHNNLGIVFQELGLFEASERAHRDALKARPAYADAYSNLALVLRMMNRVDEAIAAGQEAIRLNHDLADAHSNLSLALLLAGRYEEAWPEYEWRWKLSRFAKPPEFDKPRWSGEPLEGRTLLVHAEQGLGDTIQFCRYLPMLADQGPVYLLAPASLATLLRTLPGIAGVIAEGDEMPEFDFVCPLLSLPGIVGTTSETIPGEVPYLTADPDRVAFWREHVKPLKGLRVGLVWAGGETLISDRRRSLKLAQLAKLAQVEGVDFISLQKGDAAKQKSASSATLHDWTDELSDFADTAALIETLDLVVSVDTAVAHLAGALAKPVWLLNRFDTDWRWLLGRDDSPWYPTLRQFRQTKPGDWAGVLDRVAEELNVYFPAPVPLKPAKARKAKS
jgi:tetratricopeptide (TPR) repeat protein